MVTLVILAEVKVAPALSLPPIWIERHCKNQEFTPEQRHAYRLDKAQPIMDTFIKWLIHNTQGSLPKSPLGKAITYTLDIPMMLTPHSGDVDPSVDFGLKNEILTKLQFFS